MADRGSETEGDFAISEDFVPSPTHKAAETNTIDFDGLLQPGLTLHQNLATGNGGQAWPAGIVLAKYLLRKKRDDLKDSVIVELGAGGVSNSRKNTSGVSSHYYWRYSSHIAGGL